MCSEQILRSLYQKGVGYKKLGVIVSSLVKESEYQRSFFVHEDSYHSKELMRVVDHINLREGGDMICFGLTQSDQEIFSMKQKRRSQSFTTKWRDIGIVS